MPPASALVHTTAALSSIATSGPKWLASGSAGETTSGVPKDPYRGRKAASI